MLTEVPAMRAQLQAGVIDDESVYAHWMEALQVCLLGQFAETLSAVGGNTDAACNVVDRADRIVVTFRRKPEIQHDRTFYIL